MTKVNVASDFGARLWGRYPDDGPLSGQKFREEFLIPLLCKGKKVTLNFDGITAAPSSFFEEAFGGLVRAAVRDAEILNSILGCDYAESDSEKIARDIYSRLKIISTDDYVMEQLSNIERWMILSMKVRKNGNH